MQTNSRKEAGTARLRTPLRHWIFLSVIQFSLIAMIWPGTLLVDSLTPYFFGLPLPFAWYVLWVAVIFVATVSVYLADNRAAARS